MFAGILAVLNIFLVVAQLNWDKKLTFRAGVSRLVKGAGWGGGDLAEATIARCTALRP